MICLRKPQAAVDASPDLQRWLQERYVPHHELEPDSIRQMAIGVRKFSEYLRRPATIGDLEREAVVGFLNWYAQQVAPATVANKRRQLMSLWHFAAEEDEAAPPGRVKSIKVPTMEPDGWDEYELARLLTAIERLPGELPNGVPRALFFRAFALSLLSHGLRIKAALAVRKAEVRHDRTFTVRWRSQKTWVEQTKKFSAEAWEVIEQVHRYGEFEAVLPWPCRLRRLRQWWSRILTAAGMPVGRREGAQKLRRTSASFKERQQPGSAQGFLGHRTAGLAAKHYLVPRIVRPEACEPPVIRFA